MIRKTFIILLFFIVARIIVNCCHYVDTTYVDYSLISLISGDKIVQSSVEQNDSIYFNDLVVQINFDYSRTAQISRTSSYDLYAFDCYDKYELVNKIVDLNVITLADYNDQYLKNTEIEVNYKVYEYYDAGFTNTKDIVIRRLNDIGIRRPDAIIYFKLKDKPKVNEFHRFLIKVQFKDGSELSDTTRFLYIKG